MYDRVIRYVNFGFFLGFRRFGWEGVVSDFCRFVWCGWIMVGVSMGVGVFVKFVISYLLLGWLCYCICDCKRWYCVAYLCGWFYFC